MHTPHLYRDLDTAYQRLTTRTRPRPWQAGYATLDELVAAIRDDHPDATRSDDAVRRLLAAGPTDNNAWTVALYALAPALRARIGRAVTAEYRTDALTDLAFVLIDAVGIDRPGLAHRLVNRAHNRVHHAATRAREHGSVHQTITAPTDPARFAGEPAANGDLAELVTQRVDLARFHHAVDAAVTAGAMSTTLWNAYRSHRLVRAVDPSQPPCDGIQRQLARRATIRLAPYVDKYLHAA